MLSAEQHAPDTVLPGGQPPRALSGPRHPRPGTEGGAQKNRSVRTGAHVT